MEFGNTFAIHPGLTNPHLYRKQCFEEPKILSARAMTFENRQLLHFVVHMAQTY